jgi:hypothetical protein
MALRWSHVALGDQPLGSWNHALSGKAMSVGRCRMHVEPAGRAARRGNGVWRHDLRSFEAIELRQKATVEMRGLRPLMRALREEKRRVLCMVK